MPPLSSVVGCIRDAGQTGSDPVDASSGCVALLLAGGDGKRLQELTHKISGAPVPKQYCRLFSGPSLLQTTVSRAQAFTPPERICVVINENHRHFAKEQLESLPASNILIQPMNRDTGPGMLFALMHLDRIYHDPVIAVFPTDHYIDDDRAFVAHVSRAVEMVRHMPDKIALLGISPDRPEIGYGYIVPSMPLGTYERAYHVDAFAEKPSPIDVRKIISRGGMWNTFVFVFKLSRMMELLWKLVPNECAKLLPLNREPERAAELYRSLESWNLSSRILTRIPQHLIMLEVGDVRWSDLGTPESVERTYRSLNLVPFWNSAAGVTDPMPTVRLSEGIV